MKKYSLIEIKNESEYHLFKCTGSVNGLENDPESLCGKTDRSLGQRFVFYCESEDMSRVKCAHYGRTVCSDCISILYGKESKDELQNENKDLADRENKK